MKNSTIIALFVILVVSVITREYAYTLISIVGLGARVLPVLIAMSREDE